MRDVRVEGTPHRLDASHEHHLLSIGLEALTNALKHSGARRIDIVLRFTPDCDGADRSGRWLWAGAGTQDVPAVPFRPAGIRERVDKLGGTLQMDSTPGAGTRLSVTRARRGAQRRGCRRARPG